MLKIDWIWAGTEQARKNAIEPHLTESNLLELKELSAKKDRLHIESMEAQDRIDAIIRDAWRRSGIT